MKDKKDIFLITVFKEQKPLFFVFSLFILGQVFFTIKGVETFPFLHWGMYSQLPEGTPTVYTIHVDDGKMKMSSLIDCRQQLIAGSLAKFKSLQNNNYTEKERDIIAQRAIKYPMLFKTATLEKALLNDSISVKQYPYWLLGALADMRLIKSPSIIVEANHQTIINYNHELEQ